MPSMRYAKTPTPARRGFCPACGDALWSDAAAHVCPEWDRQVPLEWLAQTDPHYRRLLQLLVVVDHAMTFPNQEEPGAARAAVRRLLHKFVVSPEFLAAARAAVAAETASPEEFHAKVAAATAVGASSNGRYAEPRPAKRTKPAQQKG